MQCDEHALGKLNKTFKDFDKALEINPDDAITYNTRGAVYFYKDDLDKAFADYETAIYLNSNHGEAYIRRGIIHLERCKYQEVIDDIEYGFELSPEFKESVIFYLQKAKQKLEENKK